MDIEVPYEKGGRVRQKGRTRAALVRAASALLDEGTTPTVEQAADRAGISRTTSYRYFRNQRELLAATYPVLEKPSLLGASPPKDLAARLALVLDETARQLIEHETALRAALRVSLEVPARPGEGPALRRGRAIRWIEEALAPLRDKLGKAGVHRLALAIRATTGIESLVWLIDVGGLSRRAAIDLMHASAGTLLSAALARRP
jgi:AcrR family transcriptional regulator